MKVTGKEVSLQALQQNRAQEANAAREAEPSKAVERASSGLASANASSVSLSHEVQEVQEIVKTAKSTPDLRQEIVDQAKADYESGQMAADPQELAALIARDLF